MLAFLLSIADKSDHDKIIYIYRKFNDEMLAFARSKLALTRAENVIEDACDVVQNAFLKITKYIKNIDFAQKDEIIRAYVLTVVENEVHNFINDSKPIEALDDNTRRVTDDNFIEYLQIKERLELVLKEIEGLDEKYSITMLYRFLNGMSVKQIAAFMGVPPKTVYTRLERGKQKLMEAMKKYDV